MPNTVQILTLRRTTKYNCRLTVPSTYIHDHGLQPGDRVLWLPQADGVLLKFSPLSPSDLLTHPAKVAEHREVTTHGSEP
jgi:hypothetical protein